MNNPRRAMLGPTAKKILLTVHIVLNSVWIGALTCVLLLSAMKHTAGGAHFAAIDHAIFVVNDSVVMNTGFGVIITASLFSLFTKWGFFDFYWLIVKWGALVLIFVMVTFFLAPVVNGSAALSNLLGPSVVENRDYLTYSRQTIWISILLIVLLGAITALSVFKPWGPRKSPFRTKRATVLTAGIVAGSLAVSAGALQFLQLRSYRAVEVQHVRVSSMEDGTYYGESSLGVIYRIEVEVENGKLLHVRVLDDDPGHYLRLAAGITQRFIDDQTPDVEVFTGATTSSKGLMLALENAFGGKERKAGRSRQSGIDLPEE